MTEATHDLLERWRRRSKRHQLAHRFAAKGCSRWHYLLGVPVVVLSTVVGAFVFAGDTPGSALRIAVGMCSVVAASLAALQTFLRLDEQSSRHQLADVGFSGIRQRIEQAQAFPPSGDAEAFCDTLRERLEALANESPLVPERYWRKARNAMREGG